MSERLAGVAVFVTAVEAGGFSAAAQKLNLSRSAVGKTVARLESRLGARLLHRTTRSLSLTDDGAAFYERCARALSDLKAAETALELGRAEPVGRLRLSAPVLLGRRCVAPILRGLAARHAGLEIEVAFTDRLVDLVEDGFDLVVRNGPLPATGALMSKRIARQRMGVFAAPAYLERHGAPQSLENLADHQGVVYSRSGRPKAWLFAEGAGHREVEMPSRLRLDDLEAIVDAAVEGFGLVWLPCWLVRERVAAGALERVLADVAPLTFDTYALWPQAPHLPSRVRVAIDAFAERLPGMLE